MVSALLLRFLHYLFGTSPFDNLLFWTLVSVAFLGFLVATIGFLGGRRSCGLFLLHSFNVFIFPRPLGPLFPFVLLCLDRRRLRHSLLILPPAKVQVLTVMLQLNVLLSMTPMRTCTMLILSSPMSCEAMRGTCILARSRFCATGSSVSSSYCVTRLSSSCSSS